MISSYNYNLGLAFYSAVSVNANRRALSYPDNSQFSYDEVNKRSNRLARFLLDENIRKGDVIAIFNDKSPDAYCLMLACLKVGAIYTNLDSTNPWERIRKILTTCDPDMFFFDGPENDLVHEIARAFHKLKRFDLRSAEFQEAISRMDSSNLAETNQVHGSDPAYIMFTSGSTGFPKGAVMSHNNVLNFIQWGQHTFDVTPADVFTNVNPIYFDNSVFDFYTSLFSGATLVPLDAAITKNPRHLVAAINDAKCTIWFSVPSLLVYLLTTKALKTDDFPSVTRIAFGGEGFPKNKLKQLYDLFGKRTSLFNVYGPTECTCICSSYQISDVDFLNMQELAPLGFMAPNFGYEILSSDEANADLGELALLGPCVGLGYYNDPERTAKSFVQNEKVAFNQVMYRTGDLVERMPNGFIHFRGRVDNQVKHMGYRVELEEIEAAFSTLPYVDEVGVVYQRISAELGQIKAFVNVNRVDIKEDDIAEDIKMLVPVYMVPRKIIILDRLPKNQNGKIDRNQLKEMA